MFVGIEGGEDEEFFIMVRNYRNPGWLLDYLIIFLLDGILSKGEVSNGSLHTYFG